MSDKVKHFNNISLWHVKLFLLSEDHNLPKPVFRGKWNRKSHILHKEWINSEYRDISVGIALGYGLDDRGSRVRLPAGAGNVSLHHRVQNGSGAHTASYPMVTRGSFRGGKAAGA
jgi:hypothetical protein